MKILSWNCRGLGTPRAVRALKRLTGKFSPQLIFLQETRLRDKEMEKIKIALKFHSMITIDFRGSFQSRGLELLWMNDWNIQLLSCSPNHIDVQVVQDIDASPWRFTSVYGFPEESHKYMTWSLLKNLYSQSSLPWLCAGDFNEVLYTLEKKGGLNKTCQQLQGFRNAVEICGFQDPGFDGYSFTWSNGRFGDDNIQLRLDSAFATDGFL